MTLMGRCAPAFHEAERVVAGPVRFRSHENDTYPVYMSAKIRRIYVTFGLTSGSTHKEYLAGDVNLT